MDKSVLGRYGIDYDKGVARCVGSEDLYARLLMMFLSETAFARAKDAYAAGDINALFMATHELKGECGSASMDELFDAVSPLVELVRSGSAGQAELDRLFSVMETAYERAREGVMLALGM